MLISVHYIIMIKQDCFLQKINVNLEDIYSIKDENNEIYKFISQDSYNRLINSLNPKEQTFQQNKLLSLDGNYQGEHISATEYKSLAGRSD